MLEFVVSLSVASSKTVTVNYATADGTATAGSDERGVRVSKESMTVPEGGRGSYTVVLGSEPTRRR